MADQIGPPSHAAGHAPLVGRERELANLRAALTAALAGHGALVLIGGEAGIGKTALVEATLAEAERQGALVLVGRCYDLAETPPYGPWTEVLARAPVAAHLPAKPGFGGQGAASQEVLFAQVCEYIVGVATTRPAVLLLDDLHWADPASLELLRVVARSLANLPVLLLATYRADEVARGHPLDTLLPLLVREARAARLTLRPLVADDLRALVATRFALAPGDQGRLVDFLTRRTEGNPLYAGEVLHTLEETGLLRRDSAAHVLGDIETARVPGLLRQVIDGRMARLGEEARELLVAAAVLGQEVPLDLWAAVSGAAEGDLIAVAERAIGARLLTETPDGRGVRFAHALIRQALYEGLGALRRPGWHRRAADALLAAPAPDPDAVAYHLHRSGDARAVEWLLRAAERAQRAIAWRTAAARLEAAVGFLAERGGNETERGWLHARLARLYRHDDFRRALRHAERALQLAAEAEDAALSVAALAERGVLRPRVGEQRGGIADLTASMAAREALSADDRARLAAAEQAHYGQHQDIRQARGQLAAWLLAPGRFTEVVALVESVVEGTPAGPEDDVPGVRFPLGVAVAFLGRPAEARRLLSEARAGFGARAHNPFMIGQVALFDLLAVQIPYYADQPGERSRVAREGERAWHQSAGQLGVDGAPAVAHLPCLVVDGRWTEAWELAMALRAGGGVNAPLLAGLFGTLAVARGEAALARELVREQFSDGAATVPGEAKFIAAIALQRHAAALALGDDEPHSAQAWLVAHDRWLSASGAVLGRAEGPLSWAAYHRAVGDLTAAHLAAEQALVNASEPRQPLALLAAHRLLGELDTATSRHSDAQAHLDAALKLAEACAAPYERALTLLALAELHLATDGRAAADARLAKARAILELLGARPALARADALAARLAAPPPPPSPAPLPFGLTAREAEVLRLAAQGLTSPEIADRLFVTPRTVGAHLTSIYTKLGVEGRAAAIRVALEHGLH